MVWGGIHFHGRTPLHLVQGNLTGVRYRNEIVRRFVLTTLQPMGPGAILQDDNATHHLMQQHQVTRMNWPARSPDMAPIDHLWDILGHHIHGNHLPAVNLAQLFQFLQREWNAIPQRKLVTLVQSMRRRCVECLGANGGFTHY